jgi:hypothetical protein
VPVKPRIPYRPNGRKLPPVTFYAVLVREVQPPPGEDPIEWLLLTNLSASTFAGACCVVEYYVCRWQIEMSQPDYRSSDRLYLARVAA